VTALDALSERAGRPLAQARALPGECYTSEELYALEVEHIFRKEWMCVARAEQLPNAGDWIALDLVGEPLVITRDANGELHALSRVCAHRMQDVLNTVDARGTARASLARITCGRTVSTAPA